MNKQFFGGNFPNIAILLLSSIVGALAEQVLPSNSDDQMLPIPPFVSGALAGLFCAALILRADSRQRQRMYCWMLASAVLMLGLLVWRFGQQGDLIRPVRIILGFGVLGFADRMVLRRHWLLITGVALAGAMITLVIVVRSDIGGMLLLWAGAGGLLGGAMAVYSLTILHIFTHVLLGQPLPTAPSGQAEPQGK